MNMAGGFLYRLSVEHQQIIRSQASLRKVARGSRLFLQGDKPAGVYFVVQGHLKLTVGGSDGRETLVGIGGSGDLIGAGSLFGGDTHATSAFALTKPTEALVLDHPSFKELLRTDPAFNASVLEELSRKIRVATQRQLELAVDDVNGRVARRLNELIQRFGEVADDGTAVLKSPVTQQDLAVWAGVSRQAVVKELRNLREAGILQTRGSRFVFSDVKRLHDGFPSVGAGGS